MLLRQAHLFSGGVDVLAKSGIWPGDFCVPRIFVRATCSAFLPELETLEKKGRLHAFRVEECPIAAQGTPLGMTGYVDDFACHLPGAGVRESIRWRPSKATHQTWLQGRDGSPTKAQDQAEKRQKKVEQTEQTEEGFNEAQTEGEEDPWGGLGMDEVQESLPGAPVQAGGHSEEATALAGQAEGLSEVKQAARLAEEWDVMQRE